MTDSAVARLSEGQPFPPFPPFPPFALDADGRVAIAVYSSGEIGRLGPGDVLGFLTYLRTENPDESTYHSGASSAA